MYVHYTPYEGVRLSGKESSRAFAAEDPLVGDHLNGVHLVTIYHSHKAISMSDTPVELSSIFDLRSCSLLTVMHDLLW